MIERKIERKKLQPIEGTGIAKLYLRLKKETMHRLAGLKKKLCTGWLGPLVTTFGDTSNV